MTKLFKFKAKFVGDLYTTDIKKCFKPFIHKMQWKTHLYVPHSLKLLCCNTVLKYIFNYTHGLKDLWNNTETITFSPPSGFSSHTSLTCRERCQMEVQTLSTLSDFLSVFTGKVLLQWTQSEQRDDFIQKNETMLKPFVVIPHLYLYIQILAIEFIQNWRLRTREDKSFISELLHS